MADSEKVAKAVLAIRDQDFTIATITKESTVSKGSVGLILRNWAAKGWLTRHRQRRGETVCYSVTATGKNALLKLTGS